MAVLTNDIRMNMNKLVDLRALAIAIDFIFLEYRRRKLCTVGGESKRERQKR